MSRPESFGFPFQPYDIQESFMKKLFDVLSNEEFGIFESRESPFFEYVQIKGVFIMSSSFYILKCIFISS